MTSAEDYPDHVDDAEQLLRAVLTRHHIERIPLPDGTLRLRISRDFFLPFRSDEIGLSAFRELAGKDSQACGFHVQLLRIRSHPVRGYARDRCGG